MDIASHTASSTQLNKGERLEIYHFYLHERIDIPHHKHTPVSLLQEHRQGEHDTHWMLLPWGGGKEEKEKYATIHGPVINATLIKC